MAPRAKITFSNKDVKPPVYVVTSLSSPPWSPIEMEYDVPADSADLRFYKVFDNVAEGEYQYKIRIGEENWFLDQNADKATDEHGFVNNVVTVRAQPVPEDGSKGETDVEPSPVAESELEVSIPNKDEEQAQDLQARLGDAKVISHQPFNAPLHPDVPVPITVIDKVTDAEQPEYGHTEPESLNEDLSKREADAEPDVELSPRPEPQTQNDEAAKPAQVPSLVIEKVDNKPSWGDNFGPDASLAAKDAHEKRLADASPDEVIISPDGPTMESSTSESDSTPMFPHESNLERVDIAPDTDSDTSEFGSAPLFKHESFDINGRDDAASETSMSIEDDPSLALLGRIRSSIREEELALDPISEDDVETETTEASTTDDEVKSGPLFSHETGLQPESELDQGPVLSHEIDISSRRPSELDMSPLFSHETGKSDRRPSELDMGPLFAHETGKRDRRPSELDMSPLLAHELGSQQGVIADDANGYQYDEEHGRMNSADPRTDVGEPLESGAPALSHESITMPDDIQVPLLPHERSSISSSISSAGSDMSDVVTPLVDEYGNPQFAHETGAGSRLWTPDRARRSQYFVQRTRGLPLTSSLAASGVRDDDPNDPSLEPFPTSKEKILEHVATISNRLPEDETVDAAHLHSPAISQACSSTDNLHSGHPSTSHLNAVLEDDEEVSDTEDLPQTPHAELPPAIKVESAEKSPETLRVETLSKGIDEVVRPESPQQTMKPLTPPDTPEKERGPKPSATQNHESTDDNMTHTKVRHHLDGHDTSASSVATDKSDYTVHSVPEDDAATPPVMESSKSPTPRARPGAPRPTSSLKHTKSADGILKWLYRVLFGSWMDPVGRFLSSVFGGPREASVAVAVLGAAATAAYYYSNGR